MERTKERLAIARYALTTLEELVGQCPVSDVVRDAAIQRFEYTFEAVRVGILQEDQTRLALPMVDDRNLTVHTYNRALAEAIYRRLAAYAQLMGQWLAAMQTRVERVQESD